jgi:hypothetical protein
MVSISQFDHHSAGSALQELFSIKSRPLRGRCQCGLAYPDVLCLAHIAPPGAQFRCWRRPPNRPAAAIHQAFEKLLQSKINGLRASHRTTRMQRRLIALKKQN